MGQKSRVSWRAEHSCGRDHSCCSIRGHVTWQEVCSFARVQQITTGWRKTCVFCFCEPTDHAVDPSRARVRVIRLKIGGAEAIVAEAEKHRGEGREAGGSGRRDGPILEVILIVVVVLVVGSAAPTPRDGGMDGMGTDGDGMDGGLN